MGHSVSAVTAALAMGAAGAAAAAAAYGRWWVAGGGGRHDKGLRAVCVLVSSAGVDGTITFTERTNLLGDRYLELTGWIRGLKPGSSHGMHIHQLGDTTNGCMSTGAHFNPHNKTHGGPSDQERHAGDLGNIAADANGVAVVSLTDSHIALAGPNSVVGRALVVHELEDDLGRGDHSEPGTQGKTSKTTGNAGGRIACGVVGLAAA